MNLFGYEIKRKQTANKQEVDTFRPRTYTVNNFDADSSYQKDFFCVNYHNQNKRLYINPLYEYFLAKEYLVVADDIYDLTKVENDLNINSRLILIKEKLNNILATLRYSSSYANVQNSYGRIFASLGVDKNNTQTSEEIVKVPEENSVENKEIKE